MRGLHEALTYPLYAMLKMYSTLLGGIFYYKKRFTIMYVGRSFTVIHYNKKGRKNILRTWAAMCTHTHILFRC